jgi:hypothetical protein
LTFKQKNRKIFVDAHQETQRDFLNFKNQNKNYVKKEGYLTQIVGHLVVSFTFGTQSTLNRSNTQVPHLVTVTEKSDL